MWVFIHNSASNIFISQHRTSHYHLRATTSKSLQHSETFYETPQISKGLLESNIPPTPVVILMFAGYMMVVAVVEDDEDDELFLQLVEI